MRKIKFFVLVALPLLVAVPLMVVAKQRRENTDFILASYPKSPSFAHYVQTHRDWVAAPNSKVNPTSKFGYYSGKNGLFYGSSFEFNGSYANQCTVDEAGRVYTVRDVYNWAMQASNNLQLTKSETEKLRLALQKLPPNSPKPPLNRLLVLSFRVKNFRETRIYDRANLPTEIKTIYQITRAYLPTLEKVLIIGNAA